MKISITIAVLFFYCLIPASKASTLARVLDRGELLCGINGNWLGMSYVDNKGNLSGMDVDICRAVAVAVLEDANAIDFISLSPKVRFKALVNNEVDILSRNSTWNYHRDTYAIEFVGINFYDGQSFLANRSSKITSLDKITENTTVCVQKYTTTEKNLVDYAKKNQWAIVIKVYASNLQVIEEFFEGRCQLITADTTELLSIRQNYAPNKSDYIVLNEKISKEPLGPAVKDNDSQWTNIVRWTLFALLEAEERGISSVNVESLLTSDDEYIRFLLGVKPGIGKALGLSDQWFYNIIKNVGNYSEIYDRHFGPKTGIDIERGLNALWKDGGIMITPTLK